MSRLPELLKDLAADAEIHEAYLKDPHAVMDKYDCTEEEKKAMLAKDVDTLKRLTGMDNLKTNGTVSAHDR